MFSVIRNVQANIRRVGAIIRRVGQKFVATGHKFVASGQKFIASWRQLLCMYVYVPRCDDFCPDATEGRKGEGGSDLGRKLWKDEGKEVNIIFFHSGFALVN